VKTLVVTITTIAKTVSWSSISITTITTISSISQTMAIRYGGSSIGGDLGDSGGGNVAEPMSIPQGGGGCYGRIAKAVAVAQSRAIAVSAVAQTGKPTLFLCLLAIRGDCQSEDDGDLGKNNETSLNAELASLLYRLRRPDTSKTFVQVSVLIWFYKSHRKNQQDATV
jgi:hypothetical protein